MNGSMTHVRLCEYVVCAMLVITIITKLTKYPTAGANIVSVKDAIPIIIPVSSDEVPLSWACRLTIICDWALNITDTCDGYNMCCILSSTDKIYDGTTIV